MLKQIPKKKSTASDKKFRSTLDQTHGSTPERQYTRAELRDKNAQYVQRKQREKLAQQPFYLAENRSLQSLGRISNVIISCIAVGTSACIVNPVAKVAAAAILVAAVTYGISKFFT